MTNRFLGPYAKVKFMQDNRSFLCSYSEERKDEDGKYILTKLMELHPDSMVDYTL